MIQFNLLPDVKQQYIKTQHTKQLVISVSFIASAVALAVFVLFLSSVYVVQKKSIHDLQSDIAANSATLKNTPNIAAILTVQSQLNSLASLNTQRPAASRLFGFLSQVTPTKATVSDLKIDFTTNTLTISGNAPSLDTVNTYVDSLKFTSYTVKDQGGAPLPAFTSVVLTSFGRSAKSATYTITVTFDPAIFNNTSAVTLSVGGQPSALSPSIIFKKGS